MNITIILKILSNKWTYVILMVITFAIVFIIMGIKMQGYKDKIEVFEDIVDELTVSNDSLIKELKFKDERIKILNAFSNSTSIIDKLPSYEFTPDYMEAIENIISDYSNSFNGVNK